MEPRTNALWLEPRHLSRRGLILLSAGAVASLAACAAAPDTSQPPSIRFGRDVCARCGMIISDPAFAAAYWTASGEARLFDDLGELVQYQHEHGETAVAYFASDYPSRTLMPAVNLSFVRSRSARTPMGTGVIAFASAADAAAFADREGGQVLALDALLSGP